MNAQEANSQLQHLKWPLRRTRLTLLTERLAQSFWPLASLAMLAVGGALLGATALPAVVFWGLCGVLLCFALILTYRGVKTFKWPDPQDAINHLDRSLPGRPLASLRDSPALGRGDPVAQSLWQAHHHRLAKQIRTVGIPKPKINIAPRDPYALRLAALLTLLVGVLFGTGSNAPAPAILKQNQQAGLGLPWEGWIEPPQHTGKPTLYMADLDRYSLYIYEGSRIILRLYDENGHASVRETISGQPRENAYKTDPDQEFTMRKSGDMEVSGTAARLWKVAMMPDEPPEITLSAPKNGTLEGHIKIPFQAKDDFAIVSGTATISLDLKKVNRTHGLAPQPDKIENLELQLPIPVGAKRKEFSETLIENLSQHPWAHLPVNISFQVRDASNQSATAHLNLTSLPARRFFDPLAASLIEQRRDLMWSAENGPRVARILKAISAYPKDLFHEPATLMQLRMEIASLEHLNQTNTLSPARREKIADTLWNLAEQIEEGTLLSAKKRMDQAQERLNQAMKNGANKEEIAELVQKLRDATRDYLRHLAREQQRNAEKNGQPEGERMEMSRDDLQRMMDRIQKLMEEGRMAEAEQALKEFQELMENMQVSESGKTGDGDQTDSPMEDLAETLREQQDLSDRSFRQLQERSNPRGDSRSGSEGKDGEGEKGSLAEQQRQLREQIERQREAIPEEEHPAQKPLEDAGEAMNSAEDALKNNDLPRALEEQSRAMEHMRQGMRDLRKAQQGEQNQQGQPDSQQQANRDPLGRERGEDGNETNSTAPMPQGQTPNERAREILGEIRRRTGERNRSEGERAYLRRLLERF